MKDKIILDFILDRCPEKLCEYVTSTEHGMGEGGKTSKKYLKKELSNLILTSKKCRGWFYIEVDRKKDKFIGIAKINRSSFILSFKKFCI